MTCLGSDIKNYILNFNYCAENISEIAPDAFNKYVYPRLKDKINTDKNILEKTFMESIIKIEKLFIKEKYNSFRKVINIDKRFAICISTEYYEFITKLKLRDKLEDDENFSKSFKECVGIIFSFCKKSYKMKHLCSYNDMDKLYNNVNESRYENIDELYKKVYSAVNDIENLSITQDILEIAFKNKDFKMIEMLYRKIQPTEKYLLNFSHLENIYRVVLDYDFPEILIIAKLFDSLGLWSIMNYLDLIFMSNDEHSDWMIKNHPDDITFEMIKDITEPSDELKNIIAPKMRSWLSSYSMYNPHIIAERYGIDYNHNNFIDESYYESDYELDNNFIDELNHDDEVFDYNGVY